MVFPAAAKLLGGQHTGDGFQIPFQAPDCGTLDLTVEVDGPLADYMQALDGSVGLTNGTYTVSDGGMLNLGARLKAFNEMSFEGGVAYSQLEKDRLYGTKLKLTGVYTYPDGSRETRKQEIYLYRWLEVVAGQDATVATGRTAAFHEKAEGSLGKFVPSKEVDLRLPVSVATRFEGEKPEFVYGGEFTGNQTASWLYRGEPNPSNPYAEDFLKVQVGELEVGELVAKSTLTGAVYIGYRPFPSVEIEWVDEILDRSVGMAKHLSILLVPGDVGAFGSTGIFTERQTIPGTSLPYGILSGWFGLMESRRELRVNTNLGPITGLPSIQFPFTFNNVVGLINEETDLLPQLEGVVRVTIPNKLNSTQFIDRLIKATKKYNEAPNELYFGVPAAVLSPTTYNSNSFVRGVIEKAGGVLPDITALSPITGRLEPIWAPGVERKLPIPD